MSVSVFPKQGADATEEKSQVESRYLHARKAWDHQWQRLEKQRNTLAMFLGISLLAHLGQALGTIAAYKNAKPVVVVAEVDELSRRASYPLKVMQAPSERLIASELIGWIEKVRTITEDRSLQDRMASDAIAMSSSRLERTVLKPFWDSEERHPYKVVRVKRIVVEVTSVTPLDRATSETDRFETWVVRWRERHESRRGPSASSIEDWSANITFARQPPPTLEDGLKNPAGIYVTEVNWSRDTPGGRG